MMGDVFEQARARITRAIIQDWVPGGKWDGDEYHATNPLRADRHPGSFSIREDGLWYDFATQEGGDFIDLVAGIRGISKLEAARLIAGVPEQFPPRVHRPPVNTTKDKDQGKPAWAPYRGDPDAHPFFPEAEIDWTDEPPLFRNWTWHYRLESGELCFSVVRTQASRQEKRIRPCYWTGANWIWGIPQEFKDRRPIYDLVGLKHFRGQKRVLVVEGEKDLEILSWSPGIRRLYCLTTWHGGAGAVLKTDWTPLAGQEVDLLPDNDEPGIWAMQVLARHLVTLGCQVRVLDTRVILKGQGGEP